MSTVFVLILLAVGIALTQAISKPRDVTLAWLRLGDLIALCLVSVALVSSFIDGGADGLLTLRLTAVIALAGFVAHIFLVQLGHRASQRIVISLTAGACLVVLTLPNWTGLLGLEPVLPPRADVSQIPAMISPLLGAAIVAGIGLSAFLMGGSLMTMLLGHAYLASGAQMTQQPFLRLTRALMAVLVVRLVPATVLGAWPWYVMTFGSETTAQRFPINELALVVGRFLAGLLVPIVLVWMAHQCVRIRSNQSATGILYVACTTILIGELLALTLTARTGVAF